MVNDNVISQKRIRIIASGRTSLIDEFIEDVMDNYTISSFKVTTSDSESKTVKFKVDMTEDDFFD